MRLNVILICFTKVIQLWRNVLKLYKKHRIYVDEQMRMREEYSQNLNEKIYWYDDKIKLGYGK